MDFHNFEKQTNKNALEIDEKYSFICTVDNVHYDIWPVVEALMCEICEKNC